jgi:hypothetical protein
MPRTPDVMKEFDVRTWIDKPIEHIEDKDMPSFIVNELTGSKRQPEQADEQADKQLGVYRKRLGLLRGMAKDSNEKEFDGKLNESDKALVDFLDVLMPGFAEFEAEKNEERMRQRLASKRQEEASKS